MSDTGLSPRRVVSFLGAATETVVRLGCGERLVGRSHECDWPPSVLALPMVSSSKIDPNADSLAIDLAVRGFADRKEPVYALRQAELDHLNPDLIIVQDHCRVCAVTPAELAASSSSCTAQQLVLKPETLEDCLGDVTRVAEALGVPARGAALRSSLEARFDAVRAAVVEAAGPGPGSRRPRVAVLEWCSPLMGCGYWIPELVELAGGVPVLCAPPGGKTPTFASVDHLLSVNPEVVVFALCGFDIPRAAYELSAQPTAQAAIAQLKHQGASLFVMDGNGLVNRSGPRLVESAEALAEAIGHPRGLGGRFGHFGTHSLMALDSALSRPVAVPTVAVSAVTRTPSKEERGGGGGGGGEGAGLKEDVEGSATPPRPPMKPADSGGTSAGSGGLNGGGGLVALSQPPPKHGTAANNNGAQSSSGHGAMFATVEAQLSALRCGGEAGVAAAFELNSPANQARFGNASANFASALHSVPAFRALVGPAPEGRTTVDTAKAPRVLAGGAGGADGGGAAPLRRVAVEVGVEVRGGEDATLEWELEHHADSKGVPCWLTARVGFVGCS